VLIVAALGQQSTGTKQGRCRTYNAAKRAVRVNKAHGHCHVTLAAIGSYRQLVDGEDHHASKQQQRSRQRLMMI
jgi:hypothetical protein